MSDRPRVREGVCCTSLAACERHSPRIGYWEFREDDTVVIDPRPVPDYQMPDAMHSGGGSR